MRYGFTFLNFNSPFIHTIVPLLAQQMKEVFPELNAQQEYVARVIAEEESSFLRTLEKGLKRMESIQAELKGSIISGEQAFELYDTYGFPFDLTSLIARERGLSVDEAAFNREMEKQRSRSRTDASKETGDWVLVNDVDTTDFIGYDYLESESKVTRYRKVKQKNKELFQLVLDRTPFYAESGGQVGDTGYLECNGEKIRVTDTKKENDLIVHFVDKLPSDINGSFRAVVDSRSRQRTMNNHSATHLLHAALRQVLGKHVEQKGSLVNENELRFDFSHFSSMTSEEIRKVENLVNQKIREDIHIDEKRNVPIDQAKQMGAMALFGEKYGDFVRVITFDPNFSVELCGGTHVPSTGRIGFFKIISESSVAAGVRRIEAITGDTAEQHIDAELTLLGEIRTMFKNPKDLLSSIRNLSEEKHALEKKLEAIHQERARDVKEQLAGRAVKVNGQTQIIERVSLPNAEALKQIAFALRNQFSDLLLVLAAEIDQKPQIAVMIGEELMKSKRFNAGSMVKELAREINGGGGGQPFFATAGGKNLEGLPAVIEKAKKLIGES